MSSIIEHARVLQTGLRFPIIQPLGVDYTCNKIGEPERDGFGARQQYRLTLNIYTEFACADFEYERAVSIAEKVLLQQLHKDVLSDIACLKMAIISGDNDAAISICHKMQEAIGL